MITDSTPQIDGRVLRYQHRRPQLLAAAVDYVLDHGIADLSLRPMASSLGVTHATLIRHFSSKEALVAEVVEHVRMQLVTAMETDYELQATSSVADLVRALWCRFSEPKEQRQFVLLAQIYGLGVRDRDRYGALLHSLVHDFAVPIEQRLLQEGWPPERVPAIATVLLAQVRGLQLDLASTGDRERVDEAFALMLDALLGSP